MTSASVLPDSDMTESASIPDRADAPISEITERFFKAIVAKVPLDRIEELHLFSPLRSGGVETGIAVVAARVPAPVVAGEPEQQIEAELEQADAAVAVTDASDEVVTDELVTDDAAIEDAGADEAGVDDVIADEVIVEDAIADEVIADEPVVQEPIVATIEEAADDASDESPYAPEALHEIVEDAIEESIEYVAEETPAVAVERHTVYTARYRLVQKGPERGKWEADVKDEADAPLITVEMVVRGVQRRAGEASETTRFTGSQIARALRMT